MEDDEPPLLLFIIGGAPEIRAGYWLHFLHVAVLGPRDRKEGDKETGK